MSQCCYSAAARGFGEDKQCQFAPRELIKIGEVFFCEVHLPWSEDDLKSRFLIETKDAEEKAQLKKYWPDSRAQQFRHRIAQALEADDDLTGLVAHGDYSEKEKIGGLRAPTSFETSFPKIEGFLDRNRTPKGIGLIAEARREYYEGAAQAYRTLRFEMKEQEAHDEEALFWELEMIARERSLPWNLSEILPKILSRLYRMSSRYGNSVGRPLLLWFATFLLAGALFAALHENFRTSELQAWSQVADLSFEQSVRPFGVWSDEGRKAIDRLLNNAQPLSDSKILLVRGMATVQTLISLTLLALFGFALRRRFRMA